MWNVGQLDQPYDDSVVQQHIHMTSSELRPTTLAQETPFYTTTRALPGSHQPSQGYYSTNMSMGGPADVLSSIQSQPRTFYRTGANPVYATNEYSSTEGTHGSSSSASFIDSRSGSYDSAFPQAVTPESGLNGTQVDAYGYMYSHNHGGAPSGPAGMTPPTLSPTSRARVRKTKAGSTSSSSSSRQRKPSKHQHHGHRGFSPPESIVTCSSTTPTTTAGGSVLGGGNRSKLRSASRTSKNTHHNPPATAEERRSRETHNNVEKQYRNRLNAHFESLLSALPESMQNGGGDEDNDEMGGAGGLDSTDRRVSKAEVLDMARKHIKSLERECLLLEGERDELRENMEKLRWLFGRCEGGPAAAAAAAAVGISNSSSAGSGAVNNGVGYS